MMTGETESQGPLDSNENEQPLQQSPNVVSEEALRRIAHENPQLESSDLFKILMSGMGIEEPNSRQPADVGHDEDKSVQTRPDTIE